MNQPIRIIEKTPLGYIIEIIETEVRIMIPIKILTQKLKEGIYTIGVDSEEKGERA